MAINFSAEADDSEFDAGDAFSLVESVKAASDIYAPVSGVVVAVNEDLEDSPELVNDEPYENGWIATLKMNDAEELDDLKDAADYMAALEADED